jgi:hypothetical protein
MPLRIGFDLDGVLADMETELVHQAELLFGESMTRVLEQRSTGDGPDTVSSEAAGDAAPDAPVIERLNMTPRQQRRLWKHVESIENFWQTLQETEPGIVSRLHALATERRWEIIFLTKRPRSAGATAQIQSQRWLESMGYALPAVYVVQKSRGRIADALGLDIVIDDRPENCLDVVTDSKARSILVWRDRDKQVPGAARRLGIGVVTSVSDCLNILVEIDSDPGNPGVIDRVRRLLGLRPSKETELSPLT